MSPSQCRAKAAEVRAIVRDQPDFAETAERIARAWEESARNMEASAGPGARSPEHLRDRAVIEDAPAFPG